MAAQITYCRCESCGTGKVKLTVRKLKNGDITARVNQCTVCKRSYGIKGIAQLEVLSREWKD